MPIKFHGEPLHYQDFPNEGVIEIEGIRYDHDFFRKLGWEMRLNKPFVIVKRDNGVISVERVKSD